MSLCQHLIDLGKEGVLVDKVLASDQNNIAGTVGAAMEENGMVNGFGTDENNIVSKEEIVEAVCDAKSI